MGLSIRQDRSYASKLDKLVDEEQKALKYGQESEPEVAPAEFIASG